MEHDIGCKIKAARIEKKLTQEHRLPNCWV